MHQVPALVPLSLEAAKKMMQGWQGTQYEDDVFEQMHLFASGVPRLLQWAFEAGGDLSTAQIALNEMSRCFKDSYASAAALFKEPAFALSLVLCSAVRWAVKDACAPGTNKAWSEIFNCRSCISGRQHCAGPEAVVVSRWCGTAPPRSGELEDLLGRSVAGPAQVGDDASAYRQGCAMGEMCGECVGCTVFAFTAWQATRPLALLGCLSWRSTPRRMSTCGRSWSLLRFAGAMVWNIPGKKPPCWTKLALPSKAILLAPGAHHDLLIPVRRIGAPQVELEYIAAQCRYGNVKGAGELAQQNKARKADEGEMDNVLLQICNQAEQGKQNCQREVWKERQEKGKYALMNCKEIFSQLECLRIYACKKGLVLWCVRCRHLRLLFFELLLEHPSSSCESNRGHFPRSVAVGLR